MKMTGCFDSAHGGGKTDWTMTEAIRQVFTKGGSVGVISSDRNRDFGKFLEILKKTEMDSSVRYQIKGFRVQFFQARNELEAMKIIGSITFFSQRVPSYAKCQKILDTEGENENA